MTTTRKFSSTDSGAPVLTGQNGSLIALLHACLVGTAGVAYGSGGTAKTAAGWTEPFTNTATKGVWRNSLAAGGTGCYCRILDDGSIATAAAREANMITYRAMTDIDTGSDPAPATATLASGVFIRKSNTADSTGRAWELVADEKSWYLLVRANATVSADTALYGGGDIESFVAGDAYRYFSMGRVTGNSAGGASNFINGSVAGYTSPSSNGFYIGRNYAQTGASISLSLAGLISVVGNAIGGSFALAATTPGTGDQHFSPCFLVGEAAIRGRLRGVYAPANNLLAQGFAATFAGPTGLAAGSVLMVSHVTGGQAGALCLETVLGW